VKLNQWKKTAKSRSKVDKNTSRPQFLTVGEAPNLSYHKSSACIPSQFDKLLLKAPFHVLSVHHGWLADPPEIILRKDRVNVEWLWLGCPFQSSLSCSI
jgi:hypothetical protein